MARCQRGAAWRTNPDGSKVRAEKITVHVSEKGKASFGAVQRCGGVHTCMDCMELAAAGYAEELETVLRAHLGADLGAVFVTVTCPHYFGDRETVLRPAVSRAWTAMQKDGTFRRLVAGLAYAGAARGFEVTIGPNGPHPHIHAALCFDRKFTNPAIEPAPPEKGVCTACGVHAWRHTDACPIGQLEQGIFDVWSRCVQAEGMKAPERYRPDGKPLGVLCVNVTRPEIARYVSKMMLAMEVSSELGKTARGLNRTMIEVLHDLHERPTPRDIAIWQEHVRASRRRRPVTWTRGKNDLRKRYGLGEEVSPADMAQYMAERDAPVAEIDRPVFEHYARTSRTWCNHVLYVAEKKGGAAVMEFVQLCLWDRPPPDKEDAS